MILTDPQRKALDRSVTRAREIAEAAAAEALAELGVAERDRPQHLTDDQNAHRLELRAKARQLGDSTEPHRAEIPLLTRDVAYEQWHRLLFARFLEQNGLLRHPLYPETALSLEDCSELAASEGEPDGWSLAARFASEILPGIFRLADPAVRIRYPRERMLELEAVLAEIPLDAFRTEDALGWVYQFWQTAEKKRVNESGRKIGGADLSPVTQLFTENYMVRFLLENSLGAWWAARHPDSPLVAEWDYLRVLEDGTPAAGTFAEWPTTAAEVTVMDPCCGSGHFLVAAFGMLWRMRAEEEGLSDADAQDAVLRDNLFGLELDPRCTQIARFNVVLEAWKQGGFRGLPEPRVLCSGVPVRQTEDEWLEDVPYSLRDTMKSLHAQFRDAETLGSLIDPRPAQSGPELGTLFGKSLAIGVSWDQLSPHLTAKFFRESEVASVVGNATEDIVRAGAMLGQRYTLVVTNPPYLGDRKMSGALSRHLESHFPAGRADLSTSLQIRCRALTTDTGTVATVLPDSWTFMPTLHPMRTWFVENFHLHLAAPLGSRAFRSISGERVSVILSVASPGSTRKFQTVSASHEDTPELKSRALRLAPVVRLESGADTRGRAEIPLAPRSHSLTISTFAYSSTGLQTGDDPRFRRRPWEVERDRDRWRPEVSSDISGGPYSGYNSIVYWPSDQFYKTRKSAHAHAARASGIPSIVIKLTGEPRATLYSGDIWHQNCARLTPVDPSDLDALWAFVNSDEFPRELKAVDSAVNARPSSIEKVSFDHMRWRQRSDEAGPLPEPHSDDPTEWLFKGEIPNATHPLQVAVARLLGYRWPDQVPDPLDAHADADGIAALVPLPHEPDAVTRLRALLSAAYGDAWNTDLERTLVTAEGGKTGRLDDWLRDTFFAQHVKVFDNRPFLWHLWDGHKDGGFSAIVNYHRLDHATLNKLTHTVLGAWIERQTEEMNAGVTGADLRLAAAKNLRERLQLVLDGESPYDTYVRWKEPHEQSIGWDPDLDDGVRLNIRPFVKARVLRVPLDGKLKWTFPRYKEEDLHLTLAEKHAARRAHEATS